MLYKHEIASCFEGVIGRAGASEAHFAQHLAQAKEAVAAIQTQREQGDLPFLDSSARDSDIKVINELAERIQQDYTDMVVIGMGASARGGKTLVALAQNPFTGISHTTRIHFIENTDPLTFDILLATVPFDKTMFVIISKSGSTVETMAQLLILLETAKQKNITLKDHFIFITEPTPNPLRKIGESCEIQMLVHDACIGGRYSVLTAVGMLPAAVAGLDIAAIRHGAEAVVASLFADAEPEPAKGAALHQALLEAGKTVSVMMPYSERLDAFSAWHQQLWAESLGKNGKGTTALRALGAFDQHSQLQQFIDGIPDKFITLITLEQSGKGQKIPAPQDPALAYLLHNTIGDLMAAEQLATKNTLIRNNRPVRSFICEVLQEEQMGALLMHFMLETVIMGKLWNVDPFGQPAVEQGKQLAREYLTKTQGDLVKTLALA